MSSRTPRGAAEGRVLDATERLLAGGESFTALSAQRIADAAGVSRSTFYVHFADKANLLIRLTERATSELFGVAEEWVGTGRGFAELERTQVAIIAQQRAHKELFAALAEVAAYDQEVARFWRARIEQFAARLEERLTADRRAGRLPADVDVEVAARFLSWGTERTVFEHIADDDGSGDARLARGIAQVVWRVVGG